MMKSLQLSYITVRLLLSVIIPAIAAIPAIPAYASSDAPSSSYTVSGTITGLNPGQSVTLAKNVDDMITISSGTATFTFFNPIPSNQPYSITVQAQPATQICTVLNNAGKSTHGDISNVSVVCGVQPLYSFNTDPNEVPYSTIVAGNDQYLYGTTRTGGINDHGTIFKMDSFRDSSYTILHSFENSANGKQPFGALTLGNGIFYGTTQLGGENDAGTIFNLDPTTGSYSVLHFFTRSEGASPSFGLVLADGYLYGTTSKGGVADRGVIFKVDPATGGFAMLHAFTAEEGGSPYGALILDKGNFYGTTTLGGVNDHGTIFKYHPNARSLSVEHSFNGSDGDFPQGALVAGQDGNLYGITNAGGVNNRGTIFKFNPTTSSLTTLHSFNGIDGNGPTALALGSDGYFYGITEYGGVNNEGTIFKINPIDSSFTSLHSFSDSEGTRPISLVLGNDGSHFYGTTRRGGANNTGTVFSY